MSEHMGSGSSSVLDNLEAAARKASAGPYKACHNGECRCGMIWSLADDAVVCCVVGSEDETITLGDGYVKEQKTNNAQYLSQLSPQTILALVGCARALEKLADAHHGWHLGMGRCICVEHEAAMKALAQLEEI